LGLTGYQARDLPELRAAARFFIEQLLFRQDADHYRLLGLEQSATEAQIKDHHRLLMRLIHPDREQSGDAWKEAYASRVNRAYNVLRDADARANYDTTLSSISHDRKPAEGGAVFVRQSKLGIDGHYPGVNRRSASRAPFIIMSGAALVAVLFVVSVYLSNTPAPPASLQLSEQPVAVPATLASADPMPQEPASPELSAQLKAKLDAMLLTVPAPVEAQAAAPDIPRSRALPERRREAMPAASMALPARPSQAAPGPEPVGRVATEETGMIYGKTGGLPMQMATAVAGHEKSETAVTTAATHSVPATSPGAQIGRAHV
jgi:hypothetical protein